MHERFETWIAAQIIEQRISREEEQVAFVASSKAVLERFIEFFRNKESIDQIGADDLTRYIIALKKDNNLGANTILHNMIVVAQFFKRQGRAGIVNGET